MTLGDDVLSVVPELRMEATSMMIDEGTIARSAVTGGTIHDTTGVYTPGIATAVYSGRCRVKRPSPTDQQVVFGDTDLSVSRYVVNLPVDAPLVEIGDVFILTDSADPEIVGVPMRIVSIVARSVLLYRQLGVEVIE